MASSSKNNIYFASDFHLGAPNYNESLKREKKIVKWLDEIKNDAKEIYLVGDIFDFWFEYKTVIPRGFVRLQGKIAELTDSGIPVTIFTGNHDMWIFDYLPQELGITLFRENIVKEYNGKKFLIGHGDGLGPGDKKYKMLKGFFASNLCQWLFARVHPNFDKTRLQSGAVLLIADTGDKVAVAAGVTDDIKADVSAVDLVRAAVEALGGKGGGGRPDMAQGGAKDASNAEAAIAAAEAVIGV